MSAMDAGLTFADRLALPTGGTGSFLVGDVYNLRKSHDMGVATEFYAIIQVTEAVTSAGAATVQFKLVSDAQAAIATDGSASEHLITGAFALAGLGTGASVLRVKLPLQPPAYEQYLGVLAVVGTAALTGGSIAAYLTTDPQNWITYPRAPR